MIEISTSLMPKNKPRYLMGVGTPLDIAEAVARGVDMFDCVLPTRNARRGSLFTSQGPLSIKSSKFKTDSEPIDPMCDCYTCRNFSRGYLRHLFHAKELLVYQLLTLHNLFYYAKLIEEIKQSIQQEKLPSLIQKLKTLYEKSN